MTGSKLCFQFTDASGWSEASVNDHLVQEGDRPFDLGRGPLFKVGLLKRSGDNHILLIVLHHIVADFWSLCITH